MPSVELRRDYSNPENERPRTLDTSWVALGRVVYGWTDQRETSVDREWWQKQKALPYLSVYVPESVCRLNSDQAVDVEESAPAELIEAQLSDGAGGSSNWIYRSNLRMA